MAVCRVAFVSQGVAATSVLGCESILASMLQKEMFPTRAECQVSQVDSGLGCKHLLSRWPELVLFSGGTKCTRYFFKIS